MELEKLTEKIIKGIFVELEASGRHVHVTKEQARTLFGHGLTPAGTFPSRGSSWPKSGSR